MIFENRLEYKFFQVYKMLPFQMVEHLVQKGYTSDYAYQTVQRIMDNIWKREQELHEQRMKQEEEWKHYITMADSINPFTGLPT